MSAKLTRIAKGRFLGIFVNVVVFALFAPGVRDSQPIL